MNSLNKILLCKRFWIFFSTISMVVYLFPLFSGHLHIPVYDNLDSNVIWNTILAHSNKLFSPNNTIIPNMMNGLPRSSYGSEFGLLLWLYYFLEPQTAFIINELLIHIIAFTGAYLLLSKYIVPQKKYYSYMLIYVGSIYFATLPFWSGSGASIASLPLTTYILLTIRDHNAKIYHWLYLVVLPLYSSFIFLYIFYIVYAGVYWIYLAIKQQKINWHLFGAIFLMGSVFLLKDYRLLYSMFIDSSFISHRVEFDVFFQDNLKETYRLIYVKFLEGHIPHAASLQMDYLLPLAIIAFFMNFMKKRFSSLESMVIWLIIVSSIALDIWDRVLQNRYTIPAIIVLSIWAIYKTPHKSSIAKIFLLILSTNILATFFQYEGFHELINYFPIFRSFNFVRFYFIDPLLFLLLLSFTLEVYIRKLSYSPIFIFIFICFQFILAQQSSFYSLEHTDEKLSFKEYYAPDIFNQIKYDILQKYPNTKNIHDYKFISYGIEPAVALYNDLYTVDGYSTNYPLQYKNIFRDIQQKVLSAPVMKSTKEMYDKWGSKLYLLGINASPTTYNLYKKANMPIPTARFNADTSKLCDIGTNFVISAYPLRDLNSTNLKFIQEYQGIFWHIWLYKIKCKKIITKKYQNHIEN